MNLQLQKKVIIVTGAASGIGETIARGLAEEGASVCLVDRNEDKLSQVKQLLQQLGATVLSITTDLSETGSSVHVVKSVIETFGRIDGLVNNAGLNDGVRLETGDVDDFTASLNTNVSHYVMLTEYALPYLVEQKGSIVNICSKTGETGQGETSGYAAANGVRLAMSNAFARTEQFRHVRINGLVVAECWTPQYDWWINRQVDPPAKLREINGRIPLGNRMTTTTEIANMAIFLLSSHAQGINGQLIHVDGGYVHLDRAAGSLKISH